MSSLDIDFAFLLVLLNPCGPKPPTKDTDLSRNLEFDSLHVL